MVGRMVARAGVPTLVALGLLSFNAGPINANVPARPSLTTSRESHAGSTVSVAVPAVAFTAGVVASGGRLQVPVLLTDPTVTARATVRSSPECGVDLVQGVTGWIDCPVSTATTLVVSLSDGRVLVHAVELGRR